MNGSDADLALKRRIRDHCSDWPDTVPRDRIREAHRNLAPSIPFTEFGVLFEEATGYAIGRSCSRTSLVYADPVLRAVADELLLLPRMTENTDVSSPVLEQEGNPDFPNILDVRFLIACLIFSTLNACNPSLQRLCTPGDLTRLMSVIARGIPAHRRWLVFPPTPANAETLASYYRGDFSRFTSREYRYVNLLEDDNIGWIATFAVDEGLQARNEYNEAFQPFVKTLGLAEFSQFRLPLRLDSTYFADPVTPRARAVGPWFVKQYAAQMGVIPEKVVFTSEGIRALRLADLPGAYVPNIAQVHPGEDFDDSLFVIDEPMIEVNNPARLCIALPQPRKVVLGGIEKGHVFETFVYRLLRGLDRILVLHPGGDQPFPDGFLRNANPERATDKVVSYEYRDPAGRTGFQMSVEGSAGSPMEELARSIGKPRTELDVLLVREGLNPHILVGECKFAMGYRGATFREGRLSVERLAVAIESSPSIREVLGLPKDLPVIPTLFVSHSGPGTIVPRPSLAVPMTHLLSGHFNSMVDSYLGSKASGSVTSGGR